MFSFVNDPDVDGVGIAFFDALGPLGNRLDLSLGGTSGWRGADWDLVERQLGIPVLNANQVHGARVLSVSGSADPRAVATEPADALVSNTKRLGLAVRAADCLPVLLADPGAGVIGAAHAGRVGLAAGILPATVSRMVQAGAEQVRAWIGPHICGQCYEVSAALAEEYCRVLPAAQARSSWGTPSLDLGAAAAEQLSELGCEVLRMDPCTRTTTSLHSYRRDGAAAGRQAGLIWLN